MQSGLRKKWPKNLSVGRLIIIGSLNQNDIENLSTIKCEFDLYMDCVGADQMYQLLDLIGHHVKSLDIKDIFMRRCANDYINTPIILERILAACPNLKKFDFASCQTMVQDNKYNLPPAAFKNYKW